MITLFVATEHGLLVARHALDWTVERHLDGRPIECVALDPLAPARAYGGTLDDRVWRSDDGGRSWEPAGPGITHARVMSLAVSAAETEDGAGVVYAGTEPSGVFRSPDAGSSWVEQTGLLALRSKTTWSFPPRPDTHHVRWIEPDPVVVGRVYVAIEAGALVRTADGGRTWEDRVPTGPYDTHTAATHRLAPDRVYSAAGDGYFESRDAGRTWTRHMDGLRHRYLVGIAADQEDPDTVVVSCADGPWSAYDPPHAESYVYCRSGRDGWRPAMEGLPDAEGTAVSRFAVHPDAPGAIYAANNRGVFHTLDAGRKWAALEIPWPRRALEGGVEALAVLVE
ncbi:MAG TPA: hypothetical protein VKW09_01200 [bacterium]|nr:hypothetical protein [bacterium]